MSDITEILRFQKEYLHDPRDFEMNRFIASAYDINEYEEVTKDIIESIDWNKYMATIGTIYRTLNSDGGKIKNLCIRDIIELSIPNQPHLGDRLKISRIAPPKFMVREEAFWEYYDKFPRVMKSLTEDECVDEGTKFYIHKNYIHVFKPEEVKI
jgi:hypothetical protein